MTNTDKNTEKDIKWMVDDINDFNKIIEVVLEKTQKISGEEKDAVVIALHGNLGAGKTTFTKELAKHLGITETVTSPTYIIQKRFEIPKEKKTKFDPFEKLIHIDTYRIDLQDELVRLGWSDDILHKENLIVVEWPENIPDLLPEKTIHLQFTFVDEVTREVELK
jgi:tRNA threonylcarbamoyladenosine biosynthesis protein TsaE